MEIFTKDIKVAELVNTNHHLLPVLNRFGIRLGVKEKTIQEICKDKGIDPDFFLNIINTYNNDNYLPESKLLSFSPLLIVDYLKKAHSYYIEIAVPKMENLLEKLVNQSNNDRDIGLIRTFYKKYKAELIHHIQYEEDTVFPYIIDLIEHKGKSIYSIQDFEKEHTNVEIKINDLKNLIIKYIEPNYNDNDCNDFLQVLYQFEKDIQDHARIEDKILIPKIIEIEKHHDNEK